MNPESFTPHTQTSPSPESIAKHKKMQMVSALLILIGAVGAVVYLNQPPKPAEIFKSNIPSLGATTIEVYNVLPKEFPSNLAIDGSVLTHSDVTRHADTGFTATAVYSVSSDILSAISHEQDLLKKDGWQVLDNRLSSNSAFMSAVYSNGDKLTITFSTSDVRGHITMTMQIEHSGASK